MLAYLHIEGFINFLCNKHISQDFALFFIVIPIENFVYIVSKVLYSASLF